MRLSPADKAFIEKRESRVRHWLWLSMPHLITPWFALEGIEDGTLPESTMGIMAAMLPIFVAALLLFAFAVVLLWFHPFSTSAG